MYFHGADSLLLGDSTHYLALAESVREGAGYVYKGAPEAYRAPGYPAFLYLFVASNVPLVIASVVQFIASAMLPVLSYFLALKIGVHRKMSLAGGIFLAFEPVMVFYGVVLMPDAFFAIFTFAAVWYAIRWCESGGFTYPLLAGFFCGVANYFRPADLYLPAAFIAGGLALLIVRRALSAKNIAALLIIPVAAFAIMAPWSVRNYITFGTFDFVSSQAPNLYKYGGGATLSIAEGRPLTDVLPELYEKARREAPRADLNDFANKNYLVAETIDIIRAHPFAYAKAYVLTLNGFWFSGNYHSLLASYGAISPANNNISYSLTLAQEGAIGLAKQIARTLDLYVAIAILGKALWFGVVALTLIGLWIYRRRPEAWVIALTCAYFSATLLSTPLGVEARHRYAINPLIIPFAAAAVHYVICAVRTRRA